MTQNHGVFEMPEHTQRQLDRIGHHPVLAAILNPYAGFPFHPFADSIPLLVGPEFSFLVDETKASGVPNPITMFEGKVLLGRDEFRALVKADIDPREGDIVEFTGTRLQALALVFASLDNHPIPPPHRIVVVHELAKLVTMELAVIAAAEAKATKQT